MNAESLARQFHDRYGQLAHSFGHEARVDFCAGCGFPPSVLISSVQEIPGDQLLKVLYRSAELLRDAAAWMICAKCGASQKLHVDHITPLSGDGTDDIDNLRVLCASCNSKKGDRHGR